jgi:FixJ family two-component response regulator
LPIDIMRQVFHLGVTDVVDKPFRPEALLDIVERELRRDRASSSSYRAVQRGRRR